MITWEQDNNNKKLKISFGENEESILLISNLTIQRDKRSDNVSSVNQTNQNYLFNILFQSFSQFKEQTAVKAVLFTAVKNFPH